MYVIAKGINLLQIFKNATKGFLELLERLDRHNAIQELFLLINSLV